MIKYFVFSITSLFCLSLQAQVELTQSNLPIIIIDSDESIIDEPKVGGHMGIIYNGANQVNHINDPRNHYDGVIGIELRGQSSLQLFDKKGYGIETRNQDDSNNNVALFGFPNENDWVLHGPYSDKTLMRNALAYTLAGDIMEYAPRTQFVELIINDDYKGVYLFTEKIKRDNGRVDIAELNETEIEGDDLTGGYILKLDKADQQSVHLGFESKHKPVPDAWQSTWFYYHYPKHYRIQDEQKAYIQNYIDQFEEVLKSDNFDDLSLGYPKWIDVQSFADYFIINELSKNPDAYRLSSYLYKDKDSKNSLIKLGPVWDYNLGFGNVDYCTGGSHTGFVATTFNNFCRDDFWVIHFWWERLLSDPNFIEAIISRWEELRANVFTNDALVSRIDSMEQDLLLAQSRNFIRYPIIQQYIWPNYTVEGSFSKEVDRLRNWIVSRAEWMDNNLSSLNDVNFNSLFQPEPKLFPNPISDNTVIQHYSHANATINLRIWNNQGKLIHQGTYENEISGYNKTALPRIIVPGLYFYELEINNRSYAGRFVKM